MTDTTAHTRTADDQADLRALVRDIFSDRPAPDLTQTRCGLDTGLWKVLADAGLTSLAAPEQLGGAGAGIAEVAVVLSAVGEFAAAVPLAETELMAGWLLAAVGEEVSGAPATIAVGDLTIAGGRLTGTAPRVPWARDVDHVIAVARDEDGQDVVVRLSRAGYELVPGVNVAGEPRDTLTVDADLPPILGRAPEGARQELRFRGALARALTTCGAAERAVELSVRYTSEREQFGRSLSKFQAVQQSVSVAAGEAAAARAAVDAAVRAVDTLGLQDNAAQLAVAVAKARSAEYGSSIARTAHQLHGAMGFTLEHQLRLVTSRIWAWRAEYGQQASWDAFVGQLAVAAGENGLWSLITGHNNSGKQNQ